MVPLLGACVDPALFGLAPWPRQRELLGAVERGPRIHVWALGRRSGKSTMAALAALHNLLFRADLDAMVRPGELRYAVVVATNQAQGRLIVRAARSIVERSPLLAGLVTRTDVDSIEFTTPDGARTALHAFPCNSRGGRGWPISLLILDEAAHFLDTDGSEQAAERVWTALVPATAQFGDDARIIVCSTPWGDSGLFASLFARAASGELAGALALRRSTAEMNPTISADFLAAEQARDPDSFDAEYLAAFVGGGAAFLDMDRVTVADHVGLAPGAGQRWIAGLDPAFSSDPFGVALVGRRRGDPDCLVVGDIAALRAPRASSFEQRRGGEDALLAQVAGTCTRYTAQAVTDQYASRAVVDRLARAGIAVRTHNMGAATKTAIFGELRARLYDGTLEVPNLPDLLAELRRLRTKYSAGSSSVVNPRVGGSHGDMAQALALAVAEHARVGVAAGGVRGGRAVGGFGDLLGCGDDFPLTVQRSGTPTGDPPDPDDPAHATRGMAGMLTREL